jgi:hypothetical protein
MMLRSTVIASTVAVLLLAAVGCRAKTTSSDGDNGSLDTSQAALVADNDDSDSMEKASDDADDGLGGADESDPGAGPSGGATTGGGPVSDLTSLDGVIKTNPGRWFKPAGCITSTRVSAGVWTHVFKDCQGPHGKATYNGTITSTWTVSAGQLEVKHTSSDFTATTDKITATFSGSRDVTYTHSGTVTTKHRVGDWTGTFTKNDDPSKSGPWSHKADFTDTWDSSTKCYTRDGSAENTIGNREFGRTMSGLKICGSIFACPSAGELELDRKDGSVRITLTVVDTGEVEITGPKGNSIKIHLLCLA